MSMMLLCMFGLFLDKKSSKYAMKKRIILNAQNLQQNTKIIQTESKINSFTQYHFSIIHLAASIGLEFRSKPITW